jgi:CBS domain-containing protein
MGIARRTAEQAMRQAAGQDAGADEVIDRVPATLRRDATLREAAEALIQRNAWGIPVLEDGGDYLGVCSVRSVAERCLPVRPDSLAPGAGLGYLRHDLEELRERLSREAGRPVADLLDLGVPAVRQSTSLPQLLLVLGRRAPLVPILADDGRRLVGVATWERAMRALWRGA